MIIQPDYHIDMRGVRITINNQVIDDELFDVELVIPVDGPSMVTIEKNGELEYSGEYNSDSLNNIVARTIIKDLL